jgi:hypothetical protein
VDSGSPLLCYAIRMNISEAAREEIIKQHGSAIAKKAAATLLKRRGVSYFKRLGKKGGSKSKRKRA